MKNPGYSVPRLAVGDFINAYYQLAVAGAGRPSAWVLLREVLIEPTPEPTSGAPLLALCGFAAISVRRRRRRLH
ncbi:MAG TPA: PEP-CTERM sorting domain-containing protein [Bryobacteraceae bacterium]|nr:PEP-CTERM sorting domain-containing protein [Bryobacteraceae bacterium]